MHARTHLAALFLAVRLAAQTETYTWYGDSAFDRFGVEVAGAGDLDGDDRDELAVGARKSNIGGTDAGIVRVFRGSNGTQLYQWVGDDAGDEFGHDVARLDDVNGDGVDDVAVAAWKANGAGAVRVFSGASGGALYTVDGAAPGDAFGWSVGGAGDVNGDGRGDLVVGAPDFGSAGRAHLFSGINGSLLDTYDGLVAGDSFGYSVAGAGDVDSDGVPDLILGAYRADVGGKGVDAAGDVNGDGVDDVVVGAWADDDSGTDCGMARVFVGELPQMTSLGFALAGSSGTPSLTGSGTLLAGDPVTLSLSNALASSSAALFVGFSTILLPFKGGTLVPAVDVLLAGLPTGPSGAITLQPDWPAGVPSGLELAFQFWIADAGGPQGFSASNAVEGIVP